MTADEGPTVPTVTRTHSMAWTYSDIPGARSRAETLIEGHLHREIESQYGPEAALRALGRVRWDLTPPSHPGALTRLLGTVTMTALVHAIEPEPEPTPREVYEEAKAQYVHQLLTELAQERDRAAARYLFGGVIEWPLTAEQPTGTPNASQ